MPQNKGGQKPIKVLPILDLDEPSTANIVLISTRNLYIVARSHRNYNPRVSFYIQTFESYQEYGGQYCRSAC
ncbi:hypothetical protein VN97_g873 [Penicillium thymicola]|uniref:Uncharacterized protein n=1 Tax=Penicillium thymicola TaxID=293382 RepID=A0AAI9TTC0_PENTH|nr:hypothetical protein VN97_g873 [Penicillium thymicola]